MLPTKRIKTEEDDENCRKDILNSDEIKIEESEGLDEADVKIEIEEVDLDSKSIKDDFDFEIEKQQLENNGEIINRPLVLTNNLEAASLYSSEEFEVLPRKAYLDMKRRIEENECLLSQYLVEKEYFTYQIAQLTAQVTKLEDEQFQNRIQDLQVQMAKLEKQAKDSDVKLQETELKKTGLENEIDGLQNYICLLSTNNAKLKDEVEALKKEKQGKTIKMMKKAKPHLYDETAESRDIMTRASNETSLQQLRETIVALVQDKDVYKNQLETKAQELKQVQEKYGKTILAFSSERRKTEVLLKTISSTEQKKKPPLVWTVKGVQMKQIAEEKNASPASKNNCI